MWTLIATEQHTKNFLGDQELAIVMFSGLFFWVFHTLYFGGCNFPKSTLLLTIFNVPDAPIGGAQILFGHQKQWSPPLNLACPKCLGVWCKCLVTGWMTVGCEDPYFSCKTGQTSGGHTCELLFKSGYAIHVIDSSFKHLTDIVDWLMTEHSVY
jgi:hypothetical protein